MSVFGRTHIVIDYLPIDYSVINAGNRLAYGKRVLREKEKKYRVGRLDAMYIVQLHAHYCV